MVSGNWSMKDTNGNVTNFDSRFVMISSNATGFHWHSLDNFKTSDSISFGNDDTIIFEDIVDFFTGGDMTLRNGYIILTLNNFELIEFIFLNDVMSSHFSGFPIYGKIDSIEIKN